MRRIEINDVMGLKELLDSLGKERAVVIQDGLGIAVIWPIEPDDPDWVEIEWSPEFLESIARSRQHFDEGKFITHEELKRELGLD